MNPKNQIGIPAAIECIVMQVNRLPSRGAHAGRLAAGMNRRTVREIDSGPTPILPPIQQRIGIKIAGVEDMIFSPLVKLSL